MSELEERLARIRLLILDVDGTLTDGFVYYGLAEGPLKRFHIRDGQGITNVQRVGVTVAFVTGDEAESTRLRAKRLAVEEVHEGVEDKAAAVRDLLARHGLSRDEAAYMGDEPGDLPGMAEVGFTAAPADAVDEVRQRVDWISACPGGRGAVRELCDAIIAAKRTDPRA
jgi:3-deoxy-D-manno-octulosonate 8-phosphate phosphatase (KDO 8-P phosphatase)